MSLNIAMNNAISGMHLNQQALSVLSQNIANVNTEGYSRQIINQSAVTIDGVGQGVRIESITRKVDTYLERAQQTQNGVTGNAAVIDDYYQRLQVLLGAPGAQNSIDAYLTGFFNNLQRVADAPDSISSRSIFVNAAQTMAEQLSELAKSVADLRFQADQDMATRVDEVNVSLNRISELNAALKRASGLGQSTAGLLDERDKALRVLTQNMNVSISYDNSGSVIVSAGNGAGLVDVLKHELRYSPLPSSQDFYTEKNLGPLTLVTLDANGVESGSPDTLITAGLGREVVSQITSGNIAALHNLRDHLLPDVLAQLDQLASRIRDAVNTVHNEGSGFPAASELTAQRLTLATDVSEWEGSIRIAALRPDGSPIVANYLNESYTGRRPLNLDLSTLNSGGEDGHVSVHTIIKEINNYFGAPPTKTMLGPINNIQMASNTDVLPSGSPPLFKFDFDMENITRGVGNVFITGITVLDDTATDITNVTAGPPSVVLDTTNTYTTTLGSADVDVALTSATGLSVGQTIYLGSPSAAVVLSGIDGIAAADMTGYFTIKAISGNTVTVTNAAGTLALTGTSVADAAPTSLITQYDTIQPGEYRRTRVTGGEFEVDFSGGTGSGFYDIVVAVGIEDSSGTIRTSNITYRVQNGVSNLLNTRFNSTAASGAAERVPPSTTQSTLRAMLVDANGVEIGKVNGVYLDIPGYLKLVATDDDTSIVIDSLNSKQLGNVNEIPPIPAANQKFSSYFALNNFFTSNALTATGDTTEGSAINFRVEQRILANANLVSTGALVQQRQPADPGLPPQYTYARFAGDNAVAQRLAGLNSAIISFGDAGGLSATQVTLQAYVGNVLADMSSKSTQATENNTNAQRLLDGFNARADSISGVNLDDELANTVIFQNAYAATARVISVVGKMYDALIDIL